MPVGGPRARRPCGSISHKNQMVHPQQDRRQDSGSLVMAVVGAFGNPLSPGCFFLGKVEIYKGREV